MMLAMDRVAHRTITALGLCSLILGATPALAGPQGFLERDALFPGPRTSASDGQRAGRPQPTPEEREAWKAMTPEQRQAEHQKRREAFLESMTPEQRQAHEARRAEFEKLSPEQRREKFGERGPRRPGEPRLRRDPSTPQR